MSIDRSAVVRVMVATIPMAICAAVSSDGLGWTGSWVSNIVQAVTLSLIIVTLFEISNRFDERGTTRNGRRLPIFLAMLAAVIKLTHSGFNLTALRSVGFLVAGLLLSAWILNALTKRTTPRTA